MLRLTLGGEQLVGFPTDCESASIKLLLPHIDQDWDSHLAALAGMGEKPLKRTYTVVAYRPDEVELDIEFALHDNPGPATLWAMQANAGDPVAIAGPGRVRLVDLNADWFLLVGDMSALPALSANIRILPANARGFAILETLSVADQQELSAPHSLQVQWIVNSVPGAQTRPLVTAVKALRWMTGTPSIWVAGESNSVRELRSYLAKDMHIDRQHRYTSGYWQAGLTEDNYQWIKRNETQD